MPGYPDLPDELVIKDEAGIKGRGLYAKVALTKGTCVIKVDPFIAVYERTYVPCYCWNCGLQFVQPAKQCSACKVATFCSASCQKALWRAEHKFECSALQNYTKLNRFVPSRDYPWKLPETPVRALAQILWKKSLYGNEWWHQIKALQSHRTRLNQEQLEYHARLSVKLAQYVGRDFVTDLETAEDLLDLCCAFSSNSFSLTTPDLTNIGVAVSPILALANHSCDINAVVIFPQGPKASKGMHLVLIKDVKAGQEILTSYVDVSSSRDHRRKELFDRYHFECNCALCSKPLDDSRYVDPREALRCPNGACNGLCCPDLMHSMRFPFGAVSQDVEDLAVRCSLCSYEGQIDITGLREELRIAKETMAALTNSNTISATQKENNTSITTDLKLRLKSVGKHLPDTSCCLFPLLRSAQLAFIENELFEDALELAKQVAAAMSLLYPPCHPVSLIQMVTLAKLIHNVLNSVDQLFLAQSALKSAIQGCSVGFGKGSSIEAEARGLLQDVEQTIRHVSVNPSALDRSRK